MQRLLIERLSEVYWWKPAGRRASGLEYSRNALFIRLACRRIRWNCELRLKRSLTCLRSCRRVDEAQSIDPALREDLIEAVNGIIAFRDGFSDYRLSAG